MNKKSILFYPRMAAANIQKNSRTYVPFILTCIITTAMFFMIHSLADNPGLDMVLGSATVRYTLQMAVRVTGLFAVIFLFYTNSFLMKQRKKEFGLYNILGMEKRHLGKVIFCETVDVAFLSLVLGLLSGTLLNKLLFLILLRIFHNQVPLVFTFSKTAFRNTCILFLVIFFLVFLNGVRQIQFKSPMELLRESQAGEKEPKSRWTLAVVGILLLGAGYYMAVTIKNPVAAVSLFFAAVFLVIIGTYLVFTAGSIAFLKILRKNKHYYYKANHFISVSGMIYRMKQNAVGLANICILSTMVLVMVSSTLCLYAGINDILTELYPRDVVVSSHDYSEENEETIRAESRKLLDTMGLKAENELEYTCLEFAAVERRGGYFEMDKEKNSILDLNNLRELYVVTLEDYEKLTGDSQTLEEGEILLGSRNSYKNGTLQIKEKEYQIKAKVGNFLNGLGAGTNAAQSYILVVRDEEDFEELNLLQQGMYGEHASTARFVYGINIESGGEEQIAFYEQLTSGLTMPEAEGGAGLKVEVACRESQRQGDMGLFGGLFFIGIFLGILFSMAAILIIYYKQISEGYDDKARFSIMRKVGMDKIEIKKAIHSQILTVFFLPLIGTGIHMAFAFPFVTRVLALFSMTNVKLFTCCVLGTFAVFSVLYLIVYQLTARVYYKIVS